MTPAVVLGLLCLNGFVCGSVPANGPPAELVTVWVSACNAVGVRSLPSTCVTYKFTSVFLLSQAPSRGKVWLGAKTVDYNTEGP